MRVYPKDMPKPKLYIACGTEDFLFEDNTRARDSLRSLGFELTWEQWPGAHDWKFWDVAAEHGMRIIAGME